MIQITTLQRPLYFFSRRSLLHSFLSYPVSTNITHSSFHHLFSSNLISSDSVHELSGTRIITLTVLPFPSPFQLWASGLLLITHCLLSFHPPLFPTNRRRRAGWKRAPRSIDVGVRHEIFIEAGRLGPEWSSLCAKKYSGQKNTYKLPFPCAA
ncbi:hypothetical protein FA15DRAFT_258695 [Coprinopsis marcescibilis]|uniref:Uncharacterized protein n=1 Tax=Coprinopsis marcescibilis TaxID=230819 RepID=A0A5C3L3R9_COPMA|nr:hypothetical protein FA15DRAFT_258695 [Coprinopsis marcescibilis]